MDYILVTISESRVCFFRWSSLLIFGNIFSFVSVIISRSKSIDSIEDGNSGLIDSSFRI